jgi:murein endopeptidase
MNALRCTATTVFLLLLAACGTPNSVTPASSDHPATERPRQGIFGAKTATRRVASDPAVAADVVDDALVTAADRAVAWWSLPEDLPPKEILDPDRAPDGSLSTGTVRSGVLLESSELTFEGEHHSIIERHRRHGTRWGTEELVDLLQYAAAYVAEREGGAPLRIGNIAKKKGGDIRWSSSHNTGRDADLAFYVVNENGESVPAPDLLRFDEDGRPDGRDDLRFDVARNWRLVEAFLSREDVNIQWLFISIPLKELLLEHARSIDADPEIIHRAESVLHQPTDAPPHADHFHLRIGCSKDDRLDGCLDYGPRWDWCDWHDVDLLARSLALATTFETDDDELKVRALEFLDEIRSPYAADVAGVWGFWASDEDVRDSAMDVAYGQYSWTANALVQIQKYVESGELPGSHLWRSYTIMRRSRDPLARDFVINRLTDHSVPPGEREYAARALSHFMEPALLPLLIDQLEAQPPGVRAEVAAIIRRITNHSVGIEDWAEADDDEVESAVAAWRRWWARNHDTPREEWLVAGFREAGAKIRGMLQPPDVDALLALLKTAEPHVVYNANRTIRDLAGRWAPLEQDDGEKLHDYWDDWWRKNRERVVSAR